MKCRCNHIAIWGSKTWQLYISRIDMFCSVEWLSQHSTILCELMVMAEPILIIGLIKILKDCLLAWVGQGKQSPPIMLISLLQFHKSFNTEQKKHESLSMMHKHLYQESCPVSETFRTPTRFGNLSETFRDRFCK